MHSSTIDIRYTQKREMMLNTRTIKMTKPIQPDVQCERDACEGDEEKRKCIRCIRSWCCSQTRHNRWKRTKYIPFHLYRCMQCLFVCTSAPIAFRQLGTKWNTTIRINITFYFYCILYLRFEPNGTIAAHRFRRLFCYVHCCNISNSHGHIAHTPKWLLRVCIEHLRHTKITNQKPGKNKNKFRKSRAENMFRMWVVIYLCRWLSWHISTHFGESFCLSLWVCIAGGLHWLNTVMNTIGKPRLPRNSTSAGGLTQNSSESAVLSIRRLFNGCRSQGWNLWPQQRLLNSTWWKKY